MSCHVMSCHVMSCHVMSCHVCMYVCMYVRTYVCMYVCMYVYTHMKVTWWVWWWRYLAWCCKELGHFFISGGPLLAQLSVRPLHVLHRFQGLAESCLTWLNMVGYTLIRTMLNIYGYHITILKPYNNIINLV